MFDLDPAAIAFVLLALSGALTAGFFTFLRRARLDPDDSIEGDFLPLDLNQEPGEENNGILIVSSGGKVKYANRVIRRWMNLPDKTLPNLEHLARRVLPDDKFLELCAFPGKADVSLQGMMMEGSSQVIPYLDGPATIVTLARPDLDPLGRNGRQDLTVLNILGELSVAMTTNADLPTTIQGILESVERLVAADIAELTVWREADGCLVPFRLSGPPGPDRRLDQPKERYLPGEGLSGRLFQQHEPILIPRHEQAAEGERAENDKPYPFHSYLGVPLLIGEMPVGTIELGVLTPEPYTSKDLETLQLLSHQAAIALQHAVTREEEERRVAELTGLANLVEASSSLHDVADLFSHLVKSILPLLDVEILGFLIYDENTHRLQGQAPFEGIPGHFVGLYGTDIKPDSAAAQVWLSNESIIAPQATEDPRLEVLGLGHLAQATGIKTTILTPLMVGGRSLGYLQAANKRNGSAFTGDEVRILAIVAGQTAAILENAALLSESRRRAQQAEALRRIAALVSSAATMDEILQFTLNEVARLVSAEKAGIFLVDQERFSWTPHQKSLFGVTDQAARLLPHLPLEDPSFEHTVTATQQARVLMIGSPELESDPIYKTVLDVLEVSSLLAVPLIVSDRSVGEIFLGGHSEAPFDHRAVELASTAAGQIAGAIERILLSSQTDESLRRRVEELTALTRISRELNTSHNLETLLELIHTEALATVGATCGTIVLFDPDSAETGRPEIQLAIGDRAESRHEWTPLESLFLAGQGEVRIADFNDSELDAPHEGVRSALLLPIEYQDARLGLFNLHAHDTHTFDKETCAMARALAIQAGIALGNAQAAMLTESRLETERLRNQVERLDIQAVFDVLQAIRPAASRAEVFRALGGEMVARMGFDLCLIAVPSAAGARLAEISGKIPEGVNPEALLGQRNPLRQTLQTGQAVLIASLRAKDAPDWFDSPLLDRLQAKSFICIPVQSLDSVSETEAAVLAIRLHPRPAFSDVDRHIFNLIGGQVSTALSNINLLERTAERLKEVDLLLNFSRQLGSLRSEEILRSLERSAREVITKAQAGMIVLWDERIRRLVPFSAIGYSHNPGLLELQLEAGEALPGRAFSESSPIRIDEINLAVDYNLSYDNLIRYQDATRGRVPIASLAVPIPSSGGNLGVLVLDNFTSPGAFSQEDEELISSLTRQTGLTLENARLLEEAKERAAQLEVLTGVATTITSDLQVDRITASMLDHLSQVIPFSTGTFWLRQGGVLTIRAAQGFEDDEQRVGLTVSVEDSRLLSDMVASGQPINVQDVREDARFIALPEFERLSWLGIPLIAKAEVLGVIALEKNEAHFYTREHIQIATAFSGQAAVALENARLFEESVQRTMELDERTQRLDLLNRLSKVFSSSMDTRQILQFTVEQTREAIACKAVSALIYEPDGSASILAHFPEENFRTPATVDAAPFAQLKESLGVIIAEDVRSDPAFSVLSDFWEANETRAALILSLATGNDLHGLLILHSEARLSSSEIDLARTITNQAAVAVQNAQLFDQSRRLAEELEQRVALRTQELAAEHERMETLLGIITELSASLDMDIVLNRTLTLINKITGAEQSTIILENPADASLLRRASQGYTPPAAEGGDEKPLDINDGLARWAIENRIPALIPDIRKDSRWIPRGESDHRSALAIPLMLGAEALGALLLFHREVNRFSETQLDMIQAAAKQIAVAVNNAHLYLLIRDQAERLGGMLRTQQIEASRLRAILEAVVDGVLVTDAASQVSIFNRSAERILHLAPDRVIGQSLETFTGLFGKAGRAWMEAIRAWSADPASSIEGKTFSEEIQLENDRVVAVDLAPVFTPHEFLGTVSIFRDITHVVEVDRMKSEFVATVSHELRTPLTSIKGYVDILLLGAAGELSAQQQHFLNVVQSNTERLNILVNDLLEVSRIEAGKIALEAVEVDIVSLANEVATDYRLRSQEEKKGMRIEVDSSGDPPPARGDPERIRQILDNLLGNAYSYTPVGGEISISFLTTDGFVRVGIRDNGIGISPDDQDRIFDRFYRGEAPLVTTIAGTGLGLSIVKYLVDMHGGEIWIDSRGVPGDGSTFYFTLPIYEEE